MGLFSRLVPCPASGGVSGNISQRLKEGRADGESQRETETEVECWHKWARTCHRWCCFSPSIKTLRKPGVLAGEQLCHHTLQQPLRFPPAAAAAPQPVQASLSFLARACSHFISLHPCPVRALVPPLNKLQHALML